MINLIVLLGYFILGFLVIFFIDKLYFKMMHKRFTFPGILVLQIIGWPFTFISFIAIIIVIVVVFPLEKIYDDFIRK